MRLESSARLHHKYHTHILGAERSVEFNGIIEEGDEVIVAQIVDHATEHFHVRLQTLIAISVVIGERHYTQEEEEEVQ